MSYICGAEIKAKNMKHLFEYIGERMEKSWNEEVLSDFGRSSFTGKEIAENITALHLLFRKEGIEKGDRAAIYGNNSSRWGISFLASSTFGAVAAPLLSDFRTEDAQNLVSHCGAGVLFVHSSVWASMDRGKMKSLRLAVSLDDFSVLWSASGCSGSFGRTACPKGVRKGSLHFTPFPGSDLAVIDYTSGTTSAPKGVMITYDNIATNIRYALDYIPPREGDEIVSMLPMAHMYGFMFEFLYPLCGGVRVHFLGRTPTPTLLSAALRDVRPYIVITVPMVIEKIMRSRVIPAVSAPAMKLLLKIPFVSKLILKKIRNRLMDGFGGRVRQVVMGGAALNPEVEKWMRRIGIPYTVGYGMTEASPLLAFSNWDGYVPGSCGRAADRCEVRIDSSDPEHEAGEIQARGMNIMSGYYLNPEATLEAFTEDGWLRTGDLGIMDRKGNIFIKGRIKNMILSSNGQNIYTEEVEAVINSMPSIQESVVVARGGALTALVYTEDEEEVKRGNDFAASTLRKINALLPSYSRISSMEFMPVPFEKTPKQSIKRFLYR